MKTQIVQPIYLQVGTPEWDQVIATIIDSVNKVAKADEWVTSEQAKTIIGVTNKVAFHRFVARNNIPIKKISERRRLFNRKALEKAINNELR